MKNTAIIVYVALTIAGWASAVSIGEAAGAQRSGRSAIISELSGAVELKDAQSGEWVAAKRGAELPVGGSVRTGKDSLATIRLDGDKETIYVEMDGDSRVMLVELAIDPGSGKKSTLMSLEIGKANVKAKNLSRNSVFEIKTPTSILKTQGSDSSFNVQVEKLD